MKKNCFILIMFYAIHSTAQTWIQKSNLPVASRYGCVSFSIGTRGYIGLGNDQNLIDYNDLWEWDQNTNTWTQRANFPGSARESAGSFSIGNKGYVVLGYGSSSTKELWEWNGDSNSSTYNTWTRKADFPAAARVFPVCFSIGKKGYVGTGSYAQDFWEWDGDTASATYNTWTKRADFGGGQRGWATGFSIGNKGYIGLGTDGAQDRADFWEWNGDTSSPAFDTWTQLPNFPGGPRGKPAAFSIENRGYIITGVDINNNYAWALDLWQWDSFSGWTQELSFPGLGRSQACAFSINGRGYVGTGYTGGNLRDLWEYCDTCPSINVEELEMQTGISVYPNPANQNLFIRTKQDNYNDLQLKIIDMLGQEKKIAVLKSNNIKLDISELPEGVYFVSVKGPEGTLTKKIVIEH